MRTPQCTLRVRPSLLQLPRQQARPSIVPARQTPCGAKNGTRAHASVHMHAGLRSRISPERMQRKGPHNSHHSPPRAAQTQAAPTRAADRALLSLSQVPPAAAPAHAAALAHDGGAVAEHVAEGTLVLLPLDAVPLPDAVRVCDCRHTIAHGCGHQGQAHECACSRSLKARPLSCEHGC